MIHLTNEQNNIVYSESSNVFVRANAGTGKTTTLIAFSEIRKGETFLYLVYNAENREQAKNKFPHYVKIHTIHSLAREHVGYKYNHKIYNNIEVDSILREYNYFKDTEPDGDAAYRFAYQIATNINAFCNSDKENMEDICELSNILFYMRDYWNKMTDIDNENIFITHEVYLKLFQLSKPVLDFSYIMVDEAQDSNEAMLDIVFNQVAKKIFVGDPSQKIYGFRGALNVFGADKYLDRISDKSFFTLSNSFRFGQSIADVANSILSKFGKNLVPVVGHPDQESYVTTVDKSIQYTTIFRTNAALLEFAIEKAREGRKLHIIGGIDAMYSKILDIDHLYHNRKDLIKNDYIRTLKNYNHFKSVADTLKKPDYVLLVYLFNKYENNLMAYVDTIKSKLVGKKEANVILTTAHKSKGLEFMNVLIYNDFVELSNYNFEYGEEEINLLYVAVTRAVYELELNNDLKKIM